MWISGRFSTSGVMTSRHRWKRRQHRNGGASTPFAESPRDLPCGWRLRFSNGRMLLAFSRLLVRRFSVDYAGTSFRDHPTTERVRWLGFHGIREHAIAIG